jgi:anti-sigma B factor antagonist
MLQDPSQAYQVGESDGVSVLTIADPELLLDGKEIFYEVAGRLATAHEGGRVVLNLQNLHHFQSAMLGVLINAQKRVRDAGGSVKVCCLDPEVYKVFLLTKMDQIFDIRKTEHDAVAAFQHKGPSWISKIFGN